MACSSPKPLRPGISMSEAERLQIAHGYAARAMREDDPEKALDLYRQAIDAYRELPAVWNNIGVILMDMNNYLAAKEAFDTAARLNAADPRPVYNLGLLYDRRYYLHEARDYYIESISRNNNYLPALRGVIRADRLLNEGDEETLEYIERALFLETDPNWRQMMELYRTRIQKTPLGQYL